MTAEDNKRMDPGTSGSSSGTSGSSRRVPESPRGSGPSGSGPSGSGPSGSGPSGSDPDGPGSEDRSPGIQLTERQRQEARRLRQAKRRQARRRPPVRGNPLSAGIRAVGHEVRRTAIFLGRSVLAGLDLLRPVGRAVLEGIIWLAAALRRISLAAFAVLNGGIGLLGRFLVAVDRVLTPRRCAIAVAVIAAGLLATSQFLDFRATEIGQPGYVGVEDVATAPRVDSDTPIGSHSFLLLVAAAVGLAAAAGAALTGRRRFGTFLILAGGATVLVSLVIDLPRGLDVADAELSYAGVNALLLTGFWLQITAGATLLFTGLLLLAEPGHRSRQRPGRTSRSGSASALDLIEESPS